jgi:hypothetical protein
MKKIVGSRKRPKRPKQDKQNGLWLHMPDEDKPYIVLKATILFRNCKPQSVPKH